MCLNVSFSKSNFKLFSGIFVWQKDEKVTNNCIYYNYYI